MPGFGYLVTYTGIKPQGNRIWILLAFWLEMDSRKGVFDSGEPHGEFFGLFCVG
jgi:hypothetical protein